MSGRKGEWEHEERRGKKGAGKEGKEGGKGAGKGDHHGHQYGNGGKGDKGKEITIDAMLRPKQAQACWNKSCNLLLSILTLLPVGFIFRLGC